MVVPRLKEDAGKIREVLARHRRATFVHWTPAQAVPSILQHGLLCRRELEARGIAYEPHGYGRAGKEDEFAGHVCLGFLPHWGMMSRATGSTAILEIDAAVVALEGTFFCPDNTARNDYDFAEVSSLDTYEHLDDLFEDPTSWKSSNYQAEIWVPAGIAVEQISSVSFRTVEDRDAVVSVIGPTATSLPRTIYFRVTPSQFPEARPLTDGDVEIL